MIGRLGRIGHGELRGNAYANSAKNCELRFVKIKLILSLSFRLEYFTKQAELAVRVSEVEGNLQIVWDLII